MTTPRGLGLEGKQAVVLGVADKSSIAWGIAEALLAHGARVGIGYQQRFYSRVRPILKEFPQLSGGRCDVTNDAEVDDYFAGFRDTPIDVLVHAIAFGPPEVFTHHPSDVSAEAFAETMRISIHSLSRVVRAAKPMLREGASIVTLTFQASLRAVPMYGLMGVAKAGLESLVRYLAVELGCNGTRVNAISAGPVETPAALGETLAFMHDPEALGRQRGELFRTAIAAARQDPASADLEEPDLARLAWAQVQRGFAARSAIEEVVTKDDVADAAVFLASGLSRKITGQVLHVDCGLSSSLIL